MFFKICAVFSILLKFGSSTLYTDHKCPIVEPIPKMDWNSLSGMWYEQARYDNDYEIKAHCVAVNLITGNNTFITTEFLGDEPNTVIGSMNPAANGTGVIYFHSSIVKKIDHVDDIPLTVLALDANNYAIMYDCAYDEETKKSHDYLWILSRSKTYGDDTKAFVNDFLDRTPFADKSRLLWQDFSPKSCNR